jgi:undecaprenyl-diphosphatase
MTDWLAAIILGLVEGLTEFIPVSSTGHLLLSKAALGLPDEPWNTFIVMIQLGAILAVVAVYFARLWKVLLGLPGKDPAARRFAISVLLAFLPSAILGLLFHDFIKDVLFNPTIVCITLIVGGVALIALERWAPMARVDDSMRVNWKSSLGIGLALAVIARRLELPRDGAQDLFLLGRTAGLLGHALDQITNGSPIRARLRYVGPEPGAH